MNEIVNMDNITAPLTAEETTLLYSLTAGKIQNMITKLFGAIDQKIEDMKSAMADNFNSVYAELSDIKNSQLHTGDITQIADGIKSIKEQSGKLAKIVSEKTSSQPVSDAERWITEMYSKIDIVARRRRTISGKILGSVYSTMHSKYGVDLIGEYSKFRKVRTGSKLTMCSINPTLRIRFEQSLLTVAEDKTENVPGSVLVRTMPREFRDICLSINPNKSPSYTFQCIYKEMGKRSNINLDEYIEQEGRLSIPYKLFAKSYYIYQSKSLRPLFYQVVEDMKNK